MHVRIEVFNMAGQVVSVPVDAALNSGKHQVKWSASGLGPGIYYLKLSSGKAVSYLKMTHR